MDFLGIDETAFQIPAKVCPRLSLLFGRLTCNRTMLEMVRGKSVWSVAFLRLNYCNSRE